MKIALVLPRNNYFTEIPELRQLAIDSSNFRARRIQNEGTTTSLLIVAAYIPPTIEIDYIDENFDEINYSKEYDLVCISIMTQTANRGYSIAQKFKDKGIKVVLGGVHATLLPQEAIQFADSVVIGEAEATFPQLLEDFITGKGLKSFYQSDIIVDLTKTPIPRYELIKQEYLKHYMWIPVQTSRGCPHDCEFCASTKIYGRGFRQKNIEQIITEINYVKDLFGKDVYILFSDDNFLINRKFAKELLVKIKELNIRWNCQSDIAVGNDEELLDLLKESGCVTVLIGLESVSPKGLNNLEGNNWKLKQLATYPQNIHNIQKRGIGITGSFILGLEEQDMDTFNTLQDFIIDNNIDGNITLLTPYPGTRLRDKLMAENRIITSNWDLYTLYNVTITHKNFSKKEMETGIVNIYKKIYSNEALIKKIEYFHKIKMELNQGKNR